MSKNSKSKEQADDSPTRGTVMVEYRGVASAAPGQKIRYHCRSPLIAFWPEAGVERICWQPGLNVGVAAETWATYAGEGERPGHPQIKHMIASGQVRKLTKLPTDAGELRTLIEKTLDLNALAFISDQLNNGSLESDGPLFSGEYGDRQRESLISDLAERVTKANPVMMRLGPWAAEAKTNTVHSMG